MPEQLKAPAVPGSVARSVLSLPRRAAGYVLLLPLLLIVALIYRILDLLAIPRNLWRSLRWSLDPRWQRISPNSPTFAARLAKVEVPLAEARRVAVSDLRAFRPQHPDLEGEVSTFIESTPLTLRFALRKLQWQARGTLVDRAWIEDRTACREGKYAYPELADPGWIAASTALAAVCLATVLDDALETEAQQRWMAGWAGLAS